MPTNNINEPALQLTEEQIKKKREEWGGEWQKEDRFGLSSKSDIDVRKEAFLRPNVEPFASQKKFIKEQLGILRNIDFDEFDYNSFYDSSLSQDMIQVQRAIGGEEWHNDPEKLKAYTEEVEQVLDAKELITSIDTAEKVTVQNKEDVDIAIDITDWDDAVVSWENGDGEHVIAYMENLWSEEAWEEFMKEHRPIEEEGEGTVLGFAGNDINVLQNAIGRYLRTHDLPKPSFLLNESELSENTQVMVNDARRDPDDSPIDTGIGRKDTLERIRYLLDVELSQENIDAFFNRQGAHPESAATAEQAHFLLQMGISLSKESIDGFRKKLEALEETQLELQSLEDRYDAINREIPMSELRSRTLLSVYNEIMGLSGTVNHDDFTISEVELNRNIDSIIWRAMEGEWDNDTNVKILNTYSLSFKNFKEASESNAFADRIDLGIHQNNASVRTPVSAESTLRYGLMGAQGSKWGDTALHIRKYGWDSLDQTTQDSLIEEVNIINERANEMFVANTGIEIPGGVAMLDMGKIMEGDWGLEFNKMSPIHFWITGTYLLSDMADHNYDATPKVVMMLGDEMANKIQAVEHTYGEGSLISSEQLREDPEAVRDFMMVLGLMGDLNRMSGEMRGTGKRFLDNVWERIADDPLTQRYIRSVSLAFNENLGGEMMFGMKLPEFLQMVYDGSTEFEVPVLDENGEQLVDEDGKPITRIADIGGAFTILTNTMDETTQTLVEGLMYLLDEANLGEGIKTGSEKAYALSRTTRLTGGTNRVGTLIKGKYELDTQDKNDLKELNISYVSPDDEDYGFWKDQLAQMADHNITDILSESLTAKGGDLSLASDHDKVLALFNIYLNNASTRSIMEGLIFRNDLLGKTASMGKLVTDTNMLLGRLNVTAVPDGINKDGGLSTIGFMPGPALKLADVPIPEGSKTASAKAQTIVSNNYYINWMSPRLRTTENFATFTGDDIIGGAIPQRSIDEINDTTFNNMLSTFGEAVMIGMGFDPKGTEGRANFKRDILFGLWEQEARSWGGKENDWRPRTTLDFSIGAVEKLMKQDLKMDLVPQWLDDIGFFWNEPTDKYGRFIPKVKAEFILEDRVSAPMGGRPADKTDTPRIAVIIKDASGMERRIDGFNWRVDNSEVDYYKFTKDEIARSDSEDEYTSFGGGLAIEIAGISSTILGRLGGAVEKIADAIDYIESSIPEEGHSGITSYYGEAYRKESTRAQDIRGVPSQQAKSADDIYYKIAKSLERYKFYHGEYPHWWRGASTAETITEALRDTIPDVGMSKSDKSFLLLRSVRRHF